MATGTTSISSSGKVPASAKLVEYDQFIDRQLRRTRAQVRTVDVVSTLLVLATGSLAYFLLVALLDHWAVPGGLPGWARVVACGAYVIVAGWYFVTGLLPLLLRRINPLYAAQAIESSQPTLKNSLLNFLMFRADPQGIAEAVYHAIEHQAAKNLAAVQIDSVVDRSKLIKIGYVLAGVLAVCALYKVLSPKDPLTTVGRVVMPWADILPPTRVSIAEIEPGSSKAFRGQQVKVSAEVHGLDRDAPVTLVYSTTDGQTVDRPVEMHVPQDGYRYACLLPADDDGLQQSLTYRIVAGDARSRDYTISVVAAPTIVVDSVEYIYPDYTGLSTQTVEHQGDIKAIEGTRINVHAVTNQPIKSGGIDFNCDEHEDQPLAVDGSGEFATGATASFVLRLEDNHRTSPNTSYQLWFKNEQGEENQQPIRHKIDVTPDLPPEVEFLAPKQEEAAVREGGSLTLEVSANDPDFALAKVNLHATADGRKLFERSLVGKEWRGQYGHKFRFDTKQLGLKAGTNVEYWASAEDIKQPKPNHVETAKRRIMIAPADAQGQPNDEPQPGDGDQGDPQRGDGQQGKPNQNNDADEQNQPNDDRQNSDKANQQDQQDNDAGDKQNSDNEQQQGDKSNGSDKKQGKNGKGDEADQESGDKGDQNSGEQQPSDKQDGGKNDSSGQSGKQGDNKQPGSQQGDRQNGGQQDAPSEPVPNDGSSDFDALEKILNHRQQEQQQQGNEPQSGDKPPSNQLKPQDQQQPGGPKSDEENKQTRGDKGGSEKPNNKQPDGNMKDDADDKSGNETKGQEQPGEPGKNAQDDKREDGGVNGREQSGKSGDKQGPNSQPANEKSDGKGGKPEDKQPGQGSKDGERTSTDKKPTGKNQTEGGKSNQPGKGEHSKGDDKGGAKKPADSQPRDKAKGGSNEQEKGESGAGKPGSDDNQGAPEAQNDNRQRDKSQKESAGKQDDESKTEAQSPSTSKHQSDSKGEGEGDRSGGGKSGGGQKANQPGTGGAGKNTASDEGAGKSNEKGDGETSDKAGGQKESDSPTGKSGDKQGNGSSSRPSEKPGQDKAGNPQAGDKQPNQPGKPEEGAKPGNQQAGSGDGGAQGNPQGGGGSGGSDVSRAPQNQSTAPEGDKANLEYARKATDLALEHLKDQLAKGEPDPELLKELGWSRQDLERFMHRWEELRKAADDEGSGNKEAKRELDDTLRSLGLRPRGTSLYGNSAGDDTQRGLKESRRTSPPAEYAEQYKAYTQGTARGR